MRLIVKLVSAVIVLLVIGVAFFWMTVPLNVPWRSMLQQAGVLPEWLDPAPMSAEVVDSQLVAPPGYGVSLFAEGIAEARGLRVTPAGDVLVSTPRDGRVVLLAADRNGDGVSDARRILVEGLTRPNGLDLANGYLYVGEEDGVGRIAFDVEEGVVDGQYERIIDGLPSGGNHWKKTIRFGPDGLLYVAVGSSCNVCIEEDPRRAAILRYTADGVFVDTFATGLRNSGGFDWSPATGTLYATDNGRDLLGDQFPPCELNAVVEGGFYGWPFANGVNRPGPDFGEGQQLAIDAAIPPAHEFRAHNAPLGIAFLRHRDHPLGYRGSAIVALHGSWNRTEKDGYKVVSLHFAPNGSIEERDFLTGFLNDDEAIGRPTDVAEGPDGSVYVSDDFGSAVYRVTYGASTTTSLGVSDGAASAGYDPSMVSEQERQSALALGPGVLETADCLVCHAVSADGEPGQVELTDLAAKYTVDELADYLAMPTLPMPPYDEELEQRRALAVYLLESF